ncbi:hypothetical protein SAMN05216456_1294 [Devosia crocina]|uniref:Uncharacterized protein n=1 Tax=Devosia crocina TaxID=429728 RepID=A0A1I7N9B6_9HYPH|nr:hypothetical protein [Devosia crocina]SFV31294.1 hypothetical protein SAMN05216456_1294 [Devosia crocina]
MKKMIVGALAAMAMLGGAALGQVNAKAGHVVVTGASAGQATDTQRQAPAPKQNERAAVREADAAYRHRRFLARTKHKNRAGGERAHRKWRKARSAGRR